MNATTKTELINEATTKLNGYLKSDNSLGQQPALGGLYRQGWDRLRAADFNVEKLREPSPENARKLLDMCEDVVVHMTPPANQDLYLELEDDLVNETVIPGGGSSPEELVLYRKTAIVGFSKYLQSGQSGYYQQGLYVTRDWLHYEVEEGRQQPSTENAGYWIHLLTMSQEPA